jgi:hypothetical protein
MYGFNKDTQEISGMAPMPPAIHQNVRLVKLAYEPSKPSDENSQKVFALYFENEKGEQTRLVEWPLDADHVRESAQKAGDDPEKAVARTLEAQGRRMKHILTKFIPEDKAVTNAETFTQWIKQIVSLFPKDYKEKLLRLKITASGKYANIPRYTPFVETMDVPENKSKLAFSTQELAAIKAWRETQQAREEYTPPTEVDLGLDDLDPASMPDAPSDAPRPIDDDDLPF